MVHKMGLTILVPFVIEIIQKMMKPRSSFKAVMFNEGAGSVKVILTFWLIFVNLL